MIQERGGQDSEHDGNWLAEPRRKQEGQELGLVTDLGQRHDTSRDQQRLQLRSGGHEVHDGLPGRTFIPRRQRICRRCRGCRTAENQRGDRKQQALHA